MKLKYLVMLGILLISLLIMGQGCQQASDIKTKQRATKPALGFLPWVVENSSDVKEVSFEVTKNRYARISVTDCYDYLRFNYESPGAWGNYSFVCVMDDVLSNLEPLSKNKELDCKTSVENCWWWQFTLTANCRCEYVKKDKVIE